MNGHGIGVLAEGDVDVWICSLEETASLTAGFLQTLAPDEIERADKFAVQSAREFYVCGRGLTRVILSRYLALGPEEVPLRYGQFGKPLLAGEQKLHFNVAHSGKMFCCAVTRIAEIGVDIERLRPMSTVLAISERFFSPTESLRLTSLPADLQADAFFECWTRKEAFVKATGEGIRRGLKNFSVTFGPGVAEAFEYIQAPADDPKLWTLKSFQPADGYVGAVALRGAIEALRVRQVEPA